MKKNNKQKQDKILSSLVGSVDELDTDITESEQEETPEQEESVAPRKKRKAYFITGVAILLLAAVGLGTTIRSAIGLVNDLFSQSAIKEEFAAFVYPFVITDTPSFESLEDVPASTVVTVSIWNIILNSDLSKYPTDTGIMSVPEIDVESSAVSLFGHGINVTHQTVGSIEAMFEYNEALKTYYVPASPMVMTYSPRISKISNEGELFTVTVEYLQPSMPSFNEQKEEVAEKVVIYTISRTANQKTVKSVKYESAR